MSHENKPATVEELWEMAKTFSQHAKNLEALLAAEQEKNRELNTENAGWIVVYQKLESEIVALRAELARLESHAHNRQVGA